MSRQSRVRHRARKARRHAQRAEDRMYRERGELPPRYRTLPETRDPRLRWRNLAARGGLQFGFRPTGVTVSVDFDSADEAEVALCSATAHLFHSDEGDA